MGLIAENPFENRGVQKFSSCRIRKGINRDRLSQHPHTWGQNLMLHPHIFMHRCGPSGHDQLG